MYKIQLRAEKIKIALELQFPPEDANRSNAGESDANMCLLTLIILPNTNSRMSKGWSI